MIAVTTVAAHHMLDAGLDDVDQITALFVFLLSRKFAACMVACI